MASLEIQNPKWATFMAKARYLQKREAGQTDATAYNAALSPLLKVQRRIPE